MTSLTLDESTAALGRAYEGWKLHEKAKNTRRDEFFERMTDLAAESGLAEVLVETVAANGVEATDRLEKYHPRHKVDAIRVGLPAGRDGYEYEAILIERPEFKPMSYVNAEDGTVYTKQVQDGPFLVDDERLAKENVLLYEQLVFEFPWGGTTLRPLDSLHADNLAALQPYIYRGKPVVKLAAPREATEEELAALAD
ncbi:hypothetical protein [Candidatus Solirubrobacter pratensis]|uniref:hypothetical protein n=1 Tax=Candidatus Solirubrobacter pratensis TaxID=1298857 RepID=UPI0004889DBE|nr:hypothetical protein [Candidatus Solirubrobacter pratensis]